MNALIILLFLSVSAVARVSTFKEYDDCSVVPNFENSSYGIYMTLPAGETATCTLAGVFNASDPLYFSLNVPGNRFKASVADDITMSLIGPSASGVLCAAGYNGWNHRDIELADGCSISNCGQPLADSRTGYEKHFEPFGGLVYTGVQACATRFPAGGEFAIVVTNNGSSDASISLDIGKDLDLIEMIINGFQMSDLTRQTLQWADYGEVAALPYFWFAAAAAYGARTYYRTAARRLPLLKLLQACGMYMAIAGLVVNAVQFTLVIILAIPHWEPSIFITVCLHVFLPLLTAYFMLTLFNTATFELWDDRTFPLFLLCTLYLPWFCWQGFFLPVVGGVTFLVSSALEERWAAARGYGAVSPT